MKAEDIVKSSDELCLLVCQEYRTLNGEGKPCNGEDCDVCQLTKQAEISLKAGIRKVVKEVGYLWKPQHHNLCHGVIQPHPDCICCKWQAKLKEWGVKDGR